MMNQSFQKKFLIAAFSSFKSKKTIGKPKKNAGRSPEIKLSLPTIDKVKPCQDSNLFLILSA